MPSQGRYAARAEQGGRSFSGTLVRTNPHTVRFERCPGPGIAAAYRPSSEGSLRRPHRACGLCTRRGNAEGQAPARWLWVRPSPKNTWPPGDFTPLPHHTHTHTHTHPLSLPLPRRGCSRCRVSACFWPRAVRTFLGLTDANRAVKDSKTLLCMFTGGQLDSQMPNTQA